MLRRRSVVVAAPQGSLDRAHALLFAGWLRCPSCPPGHDVRIVCPRGQVDVQTAQCVARGDCPGGFGFAVSLRPAVAPLAQADVATLSCAKHPEVALQREVSPEEWRVRFIGSLTLCTTQEARGWIADLSRPTAPLPVVRMEIEGRVVEAKPNGLELASAAYLGGAVASRFAAPGPGVIDGRVVLLDDSGGVVDERMATRAEPANPRPGPPRHEPAGPPLVLETWLTSSRPDPRQIAELVQAGHSHEHAVAFLALAERDDRHDLLDALPGGFLSGSDLEALYRTAVTGRAKSSEPLSPSLGQELAYWLRPPGDLAPHRAPAIMQGTEVAVAGLVGHRSAVGQNTEFSVRALELAGIAVSSFALPLSGSRQGRLTRPDWWPPADVLLHFPIDEIPELRVSQAWLWDAERVQGMCLWETSTLPAHLPAALRLLDAVWAPSHFVANAYEPHVDAPIHVVPHTVDVSGAARVARADLDVDDDAFVVHYSFDANSTAARKNPVMVLRAVQRAFGADPTCRVLFKVRNSTQLSWLADRGDVHARAFLTEAAQDDRVRLVTRDLARSEALGLIALSDCYLSPHRSEGFGYTLAEAMALGTPVIGTGFSGNLDFMNGSNSWLLPHTERRVQPGEYFHWAPDMTWAEPSVSAAADALQEVRHGGPSVAERTRNAHARMRDFSLDRMSAAYVSALRR